MTNAKEVACYAAAHVMGFDETHTSILSSPEVAAQLNAILARASQ